MEDIKLDDIMNVGLPMFERAMAQMLLETKEEKHKSFSVGDTQPFYAIKFLSEIREYVKRTDREPTLKKVIAVLYKMITYKEYRFVLAEYPIDGERRLREWLEDKGKMPVCQVLCLAMEALIYYMKLHERNRNSLAYHKEEELIREYDKYNYGSHKEVKPADIPIQGSFNPMKFKEYLDQYIVGQEEYKKVMSMKAYRYLVYHDRSPLLIAGPTGSGKTYAAILYPHKSWRLTCGTFRKLAGTAPDLYEYELTGEIKEAVDVWVEKM